MWFCGRLDVFVFCSQGHPGGGFAVLVTAAEIVPNISCLYTLWFLLDIGIPILCQGEEGDVSLLLVANISIPGRNSNAFPIGFFGCDEGRRRHHGSLSLYLSARKPGTFQMSFQHSTSEAARAKDRIGKYAGQSNVAPSSI
ncbi:uncharacterized protein K489DRAFT_266279 [Dissoconium aciculare CBS 342.82]|uniref:Uncharacterized protein n=1 Tax=Dissoconium aciculare CBS 342.82 TaxID=1314786 RepID=A0A6J3LZN5_9PEZI|nr:uncharacterized protein K489DRAFT_266279 [Dissoconium aciculare CBS 342.82]KAF1821118.1 hypothetical protein K489DRAFT_266279 [Dissoconium aciculare CBS 342.82]